MLVVPSGTTASPEGSVPDDTGAVVSVIFDVGVDVGVSVGVDVGVSVGVSVGVGVSIGTSSCVSSTGLGVVLLVLFKALTKADASSLLPISNVKSLYESPFLTFFILYVFPQRALIASLTALPPEALVHFTCTFFLLAVDDK